MTFAPVSYTVMRSRLVALLEERIFSFEQLELLDTDLAETRRLMRPHSADEAHRSAFELAADAGNSQQVLELGSLPELTLSEERMQPPFLRMLYGMLRSEHNISVLQREMNALNAIHRAINMPANHHKSLCTLVAEVSLGDPIGCRCDSLESHWHPDANRFDLIAYDILEANGLRGVVATQFEQAPPSNIDSDRAQQWAQLLQSNHPYPVWKE